ncbi:MAG: M50 family metallopeptidase [Planctomycetes bacterium]|nr:M50 family metallopeptidase [Planctomycetota bacterium]
MNAILKRSLISRAVALALFLLPVGYVAGILGVAVHEILGHGWSATLLGGEFSGFVLKWDTMGRAFCVLPSTAPPSHHVFHLASGVIATTICGAILLGLAFLSRKRVDIQLALLVVSFTVLMDGIPYVLWNSYHPVPPGDFGRIISLSCGRQPPEESVIRWALLTLGVLLFAGTTFYFCTSMFMRIEELILNGGQLTGSSRLLALFLFLALPGSVGWFMFDWNQLAPGVGLLPCVVGALSVTAMAALLFWYRPKSEHGEPVHPVTWRHIVVSWSCLIVTVIALALWFEDGVRWG